MAKQVSNIKVQGTVDGITYFQRNGKFYARKKPEVSKESRDNNPKLEDFRNNKSEFGAAQRPVGAFNSGLDSNLKALFADKTLSKRLGPIFRGMINRAPGARGSRPIEILANRDLLEGLELSDVLWFGEVARMAPSFAINAARSEVTMTVEPFVPKQFIKLPNRATHFQIVSHVSILSGYEFNAAEKSYLPVDPINNSSFFTSMSEPLPLNEALTLPLTLPTALSTVINLEPTSGILCFVGIRFHEERLGTIYPIASGGAMKLARVL